ncbi:dimethyladenosine transferase [Buchnera aphidicola (Cinara tujafilina)]|uniref:Ribosomal RNA small subunit methyltransferase A n=1 Tax=Buchnera aphidicola (Cinara tujafilina) TaxID=261317 RepID=F7WZ33_9GAMM|nr:16S rRNA (adenine(1518)-N(6)/adenine(1519)-N(6))-dimethyltransferase RsmA [Buchnera aphidicola]AEH39683.1 dimethyladenosine transferase [Buchnera aphidicola (Cinara tujafilina)]
MNNIKFYSHIPNRKLGQNFLINKDIIKFIIKSINIKYNDKMLEIGPGLGSLTYPVSQIVKELIILEIDKSLHPILYDLKFKNHVKIIFANAMTFDYNNFFDKYQNKLIRFFGNLPYNISTAFLLHILRYKENIYDMHFMFQKEVADRIIAQPHDKKYGRLSIVVQFFFTIKYILSIEKIHFFPVPKVDSVFLKFSPINKLYKYNIIQYINTISYITKIAFQHRRKILKHTLCHLFHLKELSYFGINALQRAENISVKQYFQLTEYFIKKTNIKNIFY